ncbi:F-box kelch-repeat protein [Musa troglodytarum]|uniref:F-box kelch-repeat protein n=3 Tax=Musa troglodytarum TaxID=320322 RepID=A0A9E7HLK5_9LILI|nr:F-box kelch-repeat protein [Musa troglodytarum]
MRQVMVRSKGRGKVCNENQLLAVLCVQSCAKLDPLLSREDCFILLLFSLLGTVNLDPEAKLPSFGCRFLWPDQKLSDKYCGSPHGRPLPTPALPSVVGCEQKCGMARSLFILSFSSLSLVSSGPTMDADLELENYMSSLMESDKSWESLSASYSGSKDIERKHVSEGNNGVTVSMVSLDSILPDDILDKIFSFLPIASIIRAASVCKVWYHIIHSMRFIWANKLPQKPWYFMFTSNEAAAGYAYDPVLRKWYNIDLPCIEKSNWFVSSSNGLVCFMDNDSRSRIFVCNPIIRDWKRILEPPGVVFPDYSSLAISVDRSSHRYTIVVIKSKQVPDDFSQWDFSIHRYNSERKSWESSINMVLPGWRGGDESVICNGVLYCLIHSTGVAGNADLRHRLMMYDISVTTPHVSSMLVTKPVPCSLTCGRLINLKERLVMVGGIAKYDKPDIIKGIGIWGLDAGEWVEVARVPHRFFQGFGELDDVFASSGTEDLIFIQSYGATGLLVFDMSQKQWKWSAKCPVTKRFPLQLFTGFCFEPRLEIVS